MSELALKLIKEAKEKRLTRLDLGNCGLTELPDELFELVWLEELILSNVWCEFSQIENNLEWIRSINHRGGNNIRSLDTNIKKMLNLKTLFINGAIEEIWELDDLNPLIELKNLKSLTIFFTQFKDLTIFEKMQNLQNLYLSITENSDLIYLNKVSNLQTLSIFYIRKNIIKTNENLNSKRNLTIVSNQFLNLDAIEVLEKNNITRYNSASSGWNENEFSFTFNEIINLNGFSKLQAVVLYISYSNEISHLGNLYLLEEVDIVSNTESRILNFENTNILIYFNNLIDLEFLKDSRQLNTLNIISNQLINIESQQETNSKIFINNESDTTLIKNSRNLKYFRNQSNLLLKIGDLLNSNINTYSHNIDNLEMLKYFSNLETLAIPFYNDIKNLDGSTIQNSNINTTFNHSVSDLSPLKEFPYLKDLEIHGCPIKNPPNAIANQGIDAIRRYFKELENKETVTNNQTKLIFVGNSRAGKTSLWQFLKDKIYNDKADSTHGIKTEIWDKETLGTEDKQNLAAHIWDFGGQEYYHATHRLFLADNAVYVLVWEHDSNKQGTRLEKFKLDDDPNGELDTVDLEHFPASYWLENIQYFAGNHCPVLIVQNKVDEEALKANYTEGGKNLPDCFHLSVKNAFEFQQGLQELEESNMDFQKFKLRLLKELRKNATAFKLVKYYAQVREALEAKAKDFEYIPVSELKDIALQFDKTPDLENLLVYLKSFTNTVLYFPQNEVLKDRLYLNPTHISRDIYKILNKEVREKNGKFDRTHIQTRLNCDVSEAERFVALMTEFDLIFEKEEDNSSVFIAPQYLKEKDKLGVNIAMFSKQLKLKPTFYLRFAAFVPRSMMSRFIAHNGQYTTDETYWKNGLIYSSKETDASIKVEHTPETRTFCIDIQNLDQQAVDMQNIVAQFVKLNSSDDKIEISNDGKKYVDLRTIRKLQHENRRNDIYYEGELVSLSDYDWLIQKQKTKEPMHLKELKEKVRNFISNDKTQEAINEVSQWAHRNNDEELKDNLSQLSGQLAKLEKDKILGILSDSDATTKQNQINNRVLNLLQSLTEPVSEPIEVIPTNSSISQDVPNNEKSTIYFSYAWGDNNETGESREIIVTKLYESLKKEVYDVRRDKENVGYKDSISEFMKEIGRGSFIVVAISDKYLKSANCMFELLQIYRKSNSDLTEFKDKIYPIVLGDAKIYDPIDRLKYVRYWKDKKETLKKEINEIGLEETIAIIGNDYKNYKEITDNIALISSLISNLNTLKPELLSQDNFEEIKKAIEARGGVVSTKPIEDKKSDNPINDTTTKITNHVDNKLRDEILLLIEQDIDKAFEELDKVFLHKNSTYMDLSGEYIDRPNNFSLAHFRSKLKRFVKMNLKLS